MKQGKILYITQKFPPEPGATVRPFSHAKYLMQMGWQVDVLTTMPSYPLGKIYDGYKGKFLLKETIDGICVRRVWSFPTKNTGFVLRAFSYLSFAIFSCIYGLTLKRYDVIISSVPNPGTELSGLIIGLLKRSFVVLELRDIIPDNLEFLGIKSSSMVSKILRRYYNFACRYSDLVAVTSFSGKESLIERNIPENKMIILQHATDVFDPLLEKHDKLRDQYGLEDKFVVLYSGSFSKYYDVSNYIEAAKIIQNYTDNVCFILIGEGAEYEKVKKLRAKYELKNVILTGGIRQEEVRNFHFVANICLTTYHSERLMPKYMFNYITTKLAEYLMAGKPVIALENDIVAGNIIKENNLGTVIETKRPDVLASVILDYFRNPDEIEKQGKAARNYAIKNLNRKEIMKKFSIILNEKI